MSVANIPSATAISPKPAPGVSTVRKDGPSESKTPTAAASATPKPTIAPASVPASPEVNQAALAAAANSQKLDVTPSGFSTFKMSA